jgi:hypothetical protein
MNYDFDPLSPPFVYQYLERHPQGTYTDFKKEFPEINISESTFSSRKHFFTSKHLTSTGENKAATNKNIDDTNTKEINKLIYEDSIEFIFKYLSTDPTKTYIDFKKDFPNSDMSSCVFYSRKHNVKKRLGSTEKRLYSKRKSNSMYLTIWQYPLESFNNKERDIIKNTIKNFINTISESGRVSWQIVELLNPSVLELREISK